MPDTILFHSLGLKLAVAFVALLIVFQFLRYLDRRVGLDWKLKIMPILHDSPVALATYLGLRLLAICVLIGLALGSFLVLALVSAPALAGPVIPSTYDKPIKQASELWLPGVPWRLWKGQLYQESRLDPTARSGVGAEGLAQFMPATWTEVTKAMKLGNVDRRMAEPSIQAGAYYMKGLRGRWLSIGDLERHRYAAASYNAGGGTIHRAFVACDGETTWAETAHCLPAVSGRFSAETIGYVSKIWTWWAALEAKA